MPGGATHSDALITHHVDNNGRNNDPSNLVPACQSCNIRRGKDERFEGVLFVVISGKREVATQLVCETCLKPFLIATKHIGRRGKGRFCSKPCLYTRDRSKDRRAA